MASAAESSLALALFALALDLAAVPLSSRSRAVCPELENLRGLIRLAVAVPPVRLLAEPAGVVRRRVERLKARFGVPTP